MEVRLPQIFIIILSIKHLMSIHINCTINKTQLDYLTDGFECEISNDLQILERNQQAESISGEFTEVQEGFMEYFYVEFGKFGESNVEGGNEDNLNKFEDESDSVDVNFEESSEETLQTQSDHTNSKESDVALLIQTVDALKLAQDFENEENYEQQVKNYGEMDINGEQDGKSKGLNVKNGNNFASNTREHSKLDLNDQQRIFKKSVKSASFAENLSKNQKNYKKKQQNKRNAQPRSATILADLIEFRKNKANIEHLTENSTNLQDMKENLKQIQKFLNEINDNDDEELFAEPDMQSNYENVNNLDLESITDQLTADFEDSEDYFDNSTDYYAEDIANSSESIDELVELNKFGNITAELNNLHTNVNDSTHLGIRVNELTTIDNSSANFTTKVNKKFTTFTKLPENTTSDAILALDQVNFTKVYQNFTNTLTKPQNFTSSIEEFTNFTSVLKIYPNLTYLSTNGSDLNASSPSVINNTSNTDQMSLKITNISKILTNLTDLTVNNEDNSENLTKNPLDLANSLPNLPEELNLNINQTNQLDLSLRISPNFTINSTSINSLITYNNTIYYIPRGISDFFKNLKLLAIVNSNLKEIRQIDLKGFPELHGLWLPYNEIEVIEWHLFDFNPNIIEIILMENRIKIINSNAFDAVVLLGQLDLLRNVCVDKAAYDVDDAKVLIDDVRENCDAVVKSLLEDYENYYVICLAVIALLCTFIAFYACLKKFSK
ncbi:hypothetical protein ACKWTF_015535 [Chironomus riparius]